MNVAPVAESIMQTKKSTRGAIKLEKRGKNAKPTLKVSEASIEKAVDDILQFDGWRSFKMEANFSEKKRRSFGEIGMPDRLYVRYAPMVKRYTPQHTDYGPEAEVLWVEQKSLNGKPSAAQRLWHAAERKRGALTLIAGVDFEASVEGFLAWYNGSGLCRRKLQ